MKVLVAGGGTAGHVFPALAMARSLERGHGAEVAFVGTPDGLESRLVPAAGLSYHAVEARPFVRRPSIDALRAPLTAIRAVRRCRKLAEEVDAVVGMGGYVSVPAVLAAVRARRPLVLHEQNAVPGLSNRVFGSRARVVALSFPEAKERFSRRVSTVVTGNPVREEIAGVPAARDALAAEALEEFDLSKDRRTIVILGGSQGALHINGAAVGAFRLLEDRQDLQAILLTGPAHHASASAELARRRGGLRVRAIAFLERMELAYAIADLVVARAGATTIAEVTACGIPSLLIPYPHATGNHQEANARAAERAGAADVLLDEDVAAASLAGRLTELVDHHARLETMSDRATAWGRPDAAARLAKLVADVAGGGW